MTDIQQICRVCPLTKPEHESKDVHHVFSEDGQLIRKPPPEKKARPSVVAEPLAGRLLALLVEKGFVTNEELIAVLTGGPHVSANPPATGVDPADLARDRQSRGDEASG